MRTLLLSTIILLSLGQSYAQREVFIKSDVAIQGYDPVAYFKESKPVKGKTEISYTWKQATWLFASQQNLDDFKSNPEKFAPQFGGYCAYGMAEGHKAPTSPDAGPFSTINFILTTARTSKSSGTKTAGEISKKQPRTGLQSKMIRTSYFSAQPVRPLVFAVNMP